MTKRIPARIHAILARERSQAVVFRRGPSDKVAIIGWDLNSDQFTLGQWLRGRIYEYRCDLSPDGKNLLYFAAKYGRINPVDEKVKELVKAKIGEFDWTHYSPTGYAEYSRKYEGLESEIRKTHAVEFEKIRNACDYSDASWTAISRVPYLKAIDLWFNGSGWNGGGWFVDSKHIWINKPHPMRGAHFHHTVSRFFCELSSPPDLRLESENGGECPGIYLPRLVRDGWKNSRTTHTYDEYVKVMINDFSLVKRFYFCGSHDAPGYGCYWEEHDLYHGKELCFAGKAWRWADYDARHKRVVFAENGAIYALSLKKTDTSPVLLYDFNDMKYEQLSAPY